jgi:hypothetical protein
LTAALLVERTLQWTASEAFRKNPHTFLEQAYYPCFGQEENGTCVANKEMLSIRAVPDFLVCNVENLSEMKEVLETAMNMKEIGRFTQGINGVKFGDSMTFGIDNFSNGSFSRLHLFRSFVEISLDEMVLFRRDFLGESWEQGSNSIQV